MFFPKSTSIAVSLVTAFAALVGCNSPKDLPVKASIVPVQNRSSEDISKQAGFSTASETPSADSNTQEIEPQELSENQSNQHLNPSDYEPPFPDRIDLFKVPPREGRGIASSTEGVEKTVELLGFVNVKSPQVVLSVDGIVTPLNKGSQIAGIEIISIQPPVVVLQRGRQRWRKALGN